MIAPSRRLIVAAAAAAAVSSAAPRIASAVLPTITFDLRVHDTGGKDASVSHAGQAVLIDPVFEQVRRDAALLGELRPNQ